MGISICLLKVQSGCFNTFWIFSVLHRRWMHLFSVMDPFYLASVPPCGMVHLEEDMDTPQPQTQTQTDTAAFAASLQHENTTMHGTKKLFLPTLAVVILLGIASGYAIASQRVGSTPAPESAIVQSDTTTKAPESAAVKVGQVFGAKDGSAFKDSAEGVLVSGGVGGEGSHHIARPGGPTQNVYLTSSVVDLKLFEGHKVKVSGETFKAQRAGWLMDVGRVEVKELNAPLPDGAVAPESLVND